MRTGLGACVVVAAIAALSRAAIADEPQSTSAIAQELFDAAHGLIDQGRYAEACPKLAESQRLDPHLGVLISLARCHELQGRTATAWAEYTEARAQAERAGRADRRALADEHARALEAKLSRVVVRLDHPVDGMEVSVDGAKVLAAVLVTAFPVDPGTHVLQATAAGYMPWTTSVDVPQGPTTVTVSIPELPVAASAGTSAAANLPPLVPVPPAADHARPPAGAPEASGDQPSSHGPGWGVWAFGAVAVGGIAVGTYFGIDAISKNSQASSICPSNNGCDAQAMTYDRQGRASATGSDIGFAVGGVAAVTAAVSFVLGRHESSTQVAVSPQGIALRGRW